MNERNRTTARYIAEWAAALSFDAIPENVVLQSRRLILDAIGTGVAATSRPIGRALTIATNAMGDGEQSVMGCRHRVGAVDAALVNGTLIHALDYDDMLFGGHASTCVLPSVLAICEASAASGRDIITAYTAGMEVFGQLAEYVPSSEFNVPHDMHAHGFHPTSVYGLIGATVGAAKAADAGVDECMHALAIAASEGCGITANFGSMVKPLHAGLAASHGVRAVQLAAAGLQGMSNALEAPEGFGTAYMRERVDWLGFNTSLGSPFRMGVRGPSIKQFASCGGTHLAIGNALVLVNEHAFSTEQIVSIEVHCNPASLTKLRFGWPEDANQAKFSLGFNVAAALVHGRPRLSTYDSGPGDSEIEKVWRLITIVPDILDAGIAAEIVIQLTTGETLSNGNRVLKGSPHAPLTDNEIVDKFTDCCTGVLDESAAKTVADIVLNLEERAEEFWQVWKRLGAYASQPV